MIKIRFVTSHDATSAFIRLQAGISMPFTPSHCEAVSQDGKSYIGQHISGGMQIRLVGYDAATMMHEKFVDLDVSDAEEASFYTFVKSKIGLPYDWQSILSFVDPDINFHLTNHAICSAMMTAGLRACGYFPKPLTVPFHHLSPRDLMLILSSHTEISHECP